MEPKFKKNDIVKDNHFCIGEILNLQCKVSSGFQYRISFGGGQTYLTEETLTLVCRAEDRKDK